MIVNRCIMNTSYWHVVKLHKKCYYKHYKRKKKHEISTTWVLLVTKKKFSRQEESRSGKSFRPDIRLNLLITIFGSIFSFHTLNNEWRCMILRYEKHGFVLQRTIFISSGKKKNLCHKVKEVWGIRRWGKAHTRASSNLYAFPPPETPNISGRYKLSRQMSSCHFFLQGRANVFFLLI